MAKTLISTPLDITTSDTAVSTVSITSGIDSTYPVYEFHWVNIEPDSNGAAFTFQVETGTDSDYDHPMTTTYWQAYVNEDGSGTFLGYSTGNDQATSGDGNGVPHRLAKEIGTDSDEGTSGILTLYNPSSTTYVKHFMASANSYQSNDATMSAYTAGYVNITAAITRVQFALSSGDIEAGTIKMFGVS
jgi:hypothetical protein